MEPLADIILNKTINKKGVVNQKFKGYPKFKLDLNISLPQFL